MKGSGSVMRETLGRQLPNRGGAKNRTSQGDPVQNRVLAITGELIACRRPTDFGVQARKKSTTR